MKNGCDRFVYNQEALQNQMHWPLCLKQKDYFTIVQMIVKDEGNQ